MSLSLTRLLPGKKLGKYHSDKICLRDPIGTRGYPPDLELVSSPNVRMPL
ncbi:hypothetical protein DSUL_50170 [Desulfovibrionales bacterium]